MLSLIIHASNQTPKIIHCFRRIDLSLSLHKNVIEHQKWNCQVSKSNIKKESFTSSLTVCFNLRNIAMFRCVFLQTILLNIATQNVSLISKEIASQSLLRFCQGSNTQPPIHKANTLAQSHLGWSSQTRLILHVIIFHRIRLRVVIVC